MHWVSRKVTASALPATPGESATACGSTSPVRRDASAERGLVVLTCEGEAEHDGERAEERCGEECDAHLGEFGGT